MARGKHAASSANARLGAAQDHIDRLTDQLADAKLRARQAEAAQRELPVVRAEVSRLKGLIEASTSDRVIDLMGQLEASEAERDAALEWVAGVRAHWDKFVNFVGKAKRDESAPPDPQAA
jgi:chromosome segregation ATPase